MIAADTSTWIAFLEGSKGEDTQLLDKALEDRQVLMVPVVLTVLLSDPKLPSGVGETLSDVHVQQLWNFYDRKTAPTKALSKAEIDSLQELFKVKYIQKMQVDERIARRAVALAQEYGLRAVDAIHAASAILKPCDCIQRFDKDYDKIAHLIKVEEPERISKQGSLSLSVVPPSS